MEIVRKTESKFLEVVCPKCKNKQTIFNKPSNTVKCLVCENILAENTGGKGIIKAKIVKVLS